MKHLKSIILLAAALLIFPFSGQSEQSELTEVSPIRAKLMFRNGAQLEDVREIDVVVELVYTVVNIINVFPSELESSLGEMPKDKVLIIGCRNGNRSSTANTILKEII